MVQLPRMAHVCMYCMLKSQGCHLRSLKHLRLFQYSLLAFAYLSEHTMCGKLELTSISAQRKVTYFMDHTQAQIHIPSNCNFFRSLGTCLLTHVECKSSTVASPPQQPAGNHLLIQQTDSLLMEMDY